jgi:DNA polymerase-1
MNMDRMPTLLIDSNYIGHQARYAVGSLSYGDISTGIIFGFLSRILSLGHMFKTNDIVFCWDSRHSVRKKSYPSYKSKRKERRTEEEQMSCQIAAKQFKILRRFVLPRIGFQNNLMVPGIESDDLIAKIVHDHLGEFIIIAADKDLYQLLYRNVRLYSPSAKMIMTRKRFFQDYGITPEQWVLVKQTAGCKSDDVKGVEGIGEKTAIKWIRKELKEKSKKYQAITSEDGKKIIERNCQLVKLPHPKTPAITLEHNLFSEDEFEIVCKTYGMNSFLEKEQKERWIELFKGEFKDDENRRAAKAPFHRCGPWEKRSHGGNR